MNSVPVLTIMGKVDIMQALVYILIAILWICIIEMANKLIFSHAIKKLTVQGG